MATNEPTEIDLDTDVIDGAYRKVFQVLRVAAPGVVRNPTRATSRAGIVFPLRWLGMDAQPHDEEPVDGLPLILPRGGGYGFHFDVRDGDPVVAVAMDGPPSQFYATGQPVTPQFVQHNEYGCSVLFPGGRVSSPETPTEPPNAAGEGFIGAEDGSACVRFRGYGLASPSEPGTVVIAAKGPTASVLAGSDTAAVPVACEPQVRANLANLNTRIQAWVPVPNDGGASLKPVIAAWFAVLQDMADQKFRVEGPGP